MAEIRDPDGVQWLVDRKWLKVFHEDEGFRDTVIAEWWMWRLMLWPFWFLAKLCGGRWQVVIERNGVVVKTERIRGWSASGRRIDEIIQAVSAGHAGPRGVPHQSQPQADQSKPDEPPRYYVH